MAVKIRKNGMTEVLNLLKEEGLIAGNIWGTTEVDLFGGSVPEIRLVTILENVPKVKKILFFFKETVPSDITARLRFWTDLSFMEVLVYGNDEVWNKMTDLANKIDKIGLWERVTLKRETTSPKPYSRGFGF